jgi:hypothetical protein
MSCTGKTDCQAERHEPDCERLAALRAAYRPGNGDALSNRAAEPGSPEYDYLNRYSSPDNRRDSMG